MPMVFSTGQRLFQWILAILQTTGPKFVPKSSYFSAKSAKFSTFQKISQTIAEIPKA